MSKKEATPVDTPDPIDPIVEDEDEENSKDEEKKQEGEADKVRVYLTKIIGLNFSPNRIRKALNARGINRMSETADVAFASFLESLFKQFFIHIYSILRETDLSSPHIYSLAKTYTPFDRIHIDHMCIPIQSGFQKGDYPLYSYPFKQTQTEDEIVYERRYSDQEQIETLYKKSLPNGENSSWSKFNLSFSSLVNPKHKKKLDLQFQTVRFTAKKLKKEKKSRVKSEKSEKPSNLEKKSKKSEAQDEEEPSQKKRKRSESTDDLSKKDEEESLKKKPKVDKADV